MAEARPFLGVYFQCCRVYARLYKAREAEVYTGRCPKCLKPVRFRVQEGGSSHRIWKIP